ncbi:MAG: glycosyl hydrolase family 18 protein [Nannocystaceae bacterium]
MTTLSCTASPSSIPLSAGAAGTSTAADASDVLAALPITDPVVDAPIDTRPRVVGYFTNWAQHRPGTCKFEVRHIDAQLFTHINYAFATIEYGDEKHPMFRLAATEASDVARLYREVNELRQKNPKLRTLLSVGGWTFNDPPTQWVFGAMAAAPETRGQFIRHAIAFVREHGFDGIDLDWEYPGAPDRGGAPRDTANFTRLLVEFRAAMHAEAASSGRSELLLTIAAAASEHYFRHMDLGAIQKPLDWINVMAYDYNGSWSTKTGPLAPLRAGGPDLTQTIDAYLAAGVPSHKLVLGMPTYGRSWKGVSSAAAGGAGTGPGPMGPCTQEEGYLASYEIAELRAGGGGYAWGWDAASETPYAYSADQKIWITYEDGRSYAKKLDLLQAKALGGAMFWAIDLDDHRAGYPLITQVSRRLLGP